MPMQKNSCTFAKNLHMLTRICVQERKEFFARVDEARDEIRQGKGISFTDTAEMNVWLNSL